MADSHQVIVRTEHLTKRFGKILAVEDLHLEIHRGEVFGFLGPNGAGKSTTIGMMLGLVEPTAGTIEIFGLELRSNLANILPRVGVVMENPRFYPYLSGGDNLWLLSRLLGGISKERIDHALEMVGLLPRARDKFKTYSQGMKQRLGIAGALLHDPEFLFLDEPTNGLDPVGMKEIRELILELGKEGKTIFLSSHLLYEVEQVCNRVAIVKQGKMIAQGMVKDLLRRGRLLQLRVPDPDKATAVLQKADWIPSIERVGDLLLVEASPEQASEVSALLAGEGIFISEMKTRENTLESFFLELIE